MNAGDAPAVRRWGDVCTIAPRFVHPTGIQWPSMADWRRLSKGGPHRELLSLLNEVAATASMAVDPRPPRKRHPAGLADKGSALSHLWGQDMRCAFDDFMPLLNDATSSGELDPLSHHKPRHLCALVSELVYHRIANAEIDDDTRVQAIPCFHYQRTLASHKPEARPLDLRRFFEIEPFVVEERGVLAIGVIAQKTLFLGFRGTQHLYEHWNTNLRTIMMRVAFPQPGARIHRGFFEETVRIIPPLHKRMERESGCNGLDKVFVTGHSLGGAIATIAAMFVNQWQRTAGVAVCTFGAPRFGDANMQLASAMPELAHVQQEGDRVPFMPPRLLGYADNLNSIRTSGDRTTKHRWNAPVPYALWRRRRRLRTLINSHTIECYRLATGSAARAQNGHLALLHADEPIGA